MAEPQTPLFTSKDLGEWLQRDVIDESATVAERVVWGWLRPILEVDTRPEEPSAELFSWAIELGGIAYVNPDGLSRYQLEDELSEYSSEARDAILRTAASGGAVPNGTAAQPLGCFPPALPDPFSLAPECW